MLNAASDSNVATSQKILHKLYIGVDFTLAVKTKSSLITLNSLHKL